MQVRWLVEARRRGSGEWQCLGTELRTPRFTTHQLRCPEGCSFRVMPTNLLGWRRAAAEAVDGGAAGSTASSSTVAAASNASALIASPPLPPLRPSSCRIELALSSRAAQEDAAAARLAKADLAHAVRSPLLSEDECPEWRVPVLLAHGQEHLSSAGRAHLALG